MSDRRDDLSRSEDPQPLDDRSTERSSRSDHVSTDGGRSDDESVVSSDGSSFTVEGSSDWSDTITFDRGDTAGAGDTADGGDTADETEEPTSNSWLDQATSIDSSPAIAEPMAVDLGRRHLIDKPELRDEFGSGALARGQVEPLPSRLDEPSAPEVVTDAGVSPPEIGSIVEDHDVPVVAPALDPVSPVGLADDASAPDPDVFDG